MEIVLNDFVFLAGNVPDSLAPVIEMLRRSETQTRDTHVDELLSLLIRAIC